MSRHQEAREHYQAEIAKYQDMVDSMRAGRITTRQQTLENPEWVDRTEADIATYEGVIRNLERAIEIIDAREAEQ